MVLIFDAVMISDVEYPFTCLGYLYVFFGKMSVQILCSLFNQVVCLFLMLSCKSSLYILDMNPLLGVFFANILSHSVSCLFILLMVSFAVQKLFSLMLTLLIFVLLPLLLMSHPKNYHQYLKELMAYVFF